MHSPQTTKHQLCAATTTPQREQGLLGGREPYVYLALDEGGDVFLAVEDGQCLKQVVFQPFPVFGDLFAGRT